MTINSASDMTAASPQTAQPISAASQECRRLWLTAFGAAARFGDVNVGATRGVELPVGVECVFAASDSDPTDTIHLDQAYVYVPGGSTVTVSWGS